VPFPRTGLLTGGPLEEIDESAETRQRRKDWRRLLYDSGYTLQSWPKEWGGRGMRPIYDAIFNDEAAAVGAPGLGVAHLERVVMMAGTPEQREKFVVPTMRGDLQWCQGFSEPSGGSDLAALKTRAVLDGDHYVVNGAKLWTSGADHADWCFLLARSEPDAPKHRGITILLVDMKTPGVRPGGVKTTDAGTHTAEVGFDDVIVPVQNRIGDPGAGWQLAMGALAYERGPGDVGVLPGYRSELLMLEDIAAERGLAGDPVIRERLAWAYVMGEVLHYDVVKQMSLRESDRPPGMEGSVTKLLWPIAVQEIEHVALDVVGPDAVTGRREGWWSSYFRSRPASVYGGTEQIQRNIVSQRLLGMPRAGR
jgi:alkylation response protein AidB-like acyl-CoA dehydrogenase